ncbi:alpha-(1,3)-fucosyltransferase C-like [Daphnia pulex]|uniref:alpha-(1,3)-fucosyltransferase C-like n=1 Tax=Daphnia pulex TaxID=6669 RepID=UPI001EE1146F|nr:alpha-(1,3)-fucosyltransferase C-like [Daphnia pulex]
MQWPGRKMRSSVKISAFVTLVGILILYNLLRVTTPPITISWEQYVQRQNGTKSILLWNASGGTLQSKKGRVEVTSFGTGKDLFAEKNCTYTRCEIVDNRWDRPLEYFDAIVVLFNDEFVTADQLKMPEFGIKRNQSQRLVFASQEAPPALKPYYNMTQLAHFFNWTMTYRIDSDIQLLYGWIIPKENAPRTPEEISNLRERARVSLPPDSKHKKTKSVAWMVSHCKTHGQRETYVKELSRYIDVDIFGKCGHLTCTKHPLHISDPQCYDMIELTYKFYLSFENAICPDYVTEKFFKILAHDIIPIVYGGVDYAQYAPPHSYIDARKFKPKELAAYLKLLDANDTLYNEYFWWKDYYDVKYSIEDMSRHGFCDLCQKLHEQQVGDFRTYKELDSEWGESNKCQPFDPGWISDPSEEILLKENSKKTMCFILLVALLCIGLFACGYVCKNKS